jgi:hypothetical protein
MCLIHNSSAERDGCSPQAFHEKCNDRSSLLVVASNTEGFVFGGYTAQKWVAADSTITPDSKAFLFRLRKNNVCDYMMYGASNDAAVWSHTSHGPCFSNTAGSNALHIMTGTVEKQAGQDYFTCHVYVDISDGYHFLKGTALSFIISI